MLSLALLSLLIALVVGQASQDPYKDFCRRYGHQAAVLDRRIYIDGGWIYTNPPSESTLSMNQGLLYGDLDNVPGEMPMVYGNLTKNNSVPDVAGGILWPDEVNKVLWLYGGESQVAPNAYQLWGYDVILNQWNLSTAPSQAASPIARVSYGAGTSLNGSGKGYYYGGYQNKFTNPSWTGAQYASSSLIIYDFDQNAMKNKTGPRDGIGRAEGAMVAIPASSTGVLIYFGGVKFPYGNQTEVPQSMDEIHIYDLNDEKWFIQKATGQIPPNRRKFCAGVAWADDRSTYNIYLYGGFGFNENATGFDDVYILTMPSFQWIKWYPEDSTQQPTPHGLLTCNVVGNSQMIVMGGNFTFSNTQCDAVDVLGFHNLNLGQNDPNGSKWYRFLPSLTTYKVPSDVVSVAGGSVTGAATQASPTAGWNDSALSVYFSQQARFPARTPRSLVSSRSGGGSPSKGHIGAIIGGAVGGVALIIAAILIFWCYRRRSKKSQVKSATAHHSHPSELAGAPARDEKNQSVSTQVVGAPGSPQMLGLSPYNTAPHGQPTASPVYAYQPAFPPTDPAYQQYHMQPSPQYPYPTQYPAYGYPPHHPGPGSPPPGWISRPQQQYYPPPENLRVVPPPAQEMPTAMSPGPDSIHSDSDRFARYPSPNQDPRGTHPPIRRKEVGSPSSPSETTATYTNDTASTHRRQFSHSYSIRNDGK